MFLIKYGESFTFHAPMIVAGDTDFAASGDWTPATGDVKVTKDEGTEANISTLPTYTNGQWKWTLSATETEAARIQIKVVDSATKAVEDQCFVIETYGHASAQIKADLDNVGLGQRLAVDIEAISGDSTAADNLETACDNYTATRGLSGTALPNAAADAAGGLPISDDGGLDLDEILARIGSPTAIGMPGSATLADMIYQIAGDSGFDVTTDSLQALRNRGDTSWITATGFPSSSTIASDVATELASSFTTVNTGIAGNLTAIQALDDIGTSDVQSACNSALVALHLDHIFAVDYDPSAKPGVATALLNELVEDDGGVARFTANAVEQAGGGGGGNCDPVEIAGEVVSQFGDSEITKTGPSWDAETSTIGLIRGDDYSAAKGRALTFNLSVPGIDLSGATASFLAKNEDGCVIEGTATILDSGGTPSLRIEWTRANLVSPAGQYDWDVEIIDSDGDVATVIHGILILQETITRFVPV